MVNYLNIETILNRLDFEYNHTADTTMAMMYSKLATLEFCGWIEESIDDILKDYVSRKVQGSDCTSKILEAIDQNYGFTYDRHIFPLFCKVIGISNLEVILNSFNTSDFQNFKNILGYYKTPRNQAAHKYLIPGVTPRFDAPNVVKYNYSLFKPCIQYLESSVGCL